MIARRSVRWSALSAAASCGNTLRVSTPLRRCHLRRNPNDLQHPGNSTSGIQTNNASRHRNRSRRAPPDRSNVRLSDAVILIMPKGTRSDRMLIPPRPETTTRSRSIRNRGVAIRFRKIAVRLQPRRPGRSLRRRNTSPPGRRIRRTTNRVASRSTRSPTNKLRVALIGLAAIKPTAAGRRVFSVGDFSTAPPGVEEFSGSE